MKDNDLGGMFIAKMVDVDNEFTARHGETPTFSELILHSPDLIARGVVHTVGLIFIGVPAEAIKQFIDFSSEVIDLLKEK